MNRVTANLLKATGTIITCFLACGTVWAQGPTNNNPTPNGVTIQLPTISVFNVNTVVSVPDGGTASLGGIRRYASGSINRGVPGLSNIPFVNRPFRSRGYGYDSSASNASVNVQIISLDEMDAMVMREAHRVNSMAQRRTTDPNGPAAVQRKADFMTRHMGRGGR